MGTLVTIVPYDSVWPTAFDEIAGQLKNLLGDRAVSIDHIGSTAVAGLSAKPFIDIDVTLHTHADMPMCCDLLTSAGYEARGSRYGDGVWAFMIRNIRPGQRVYLCPPGNQTHAERIVFRDALRQNPQIASDYAALKVELAGRFSRDGDAYTSAKQHFIQTILQDMRCR
jgi:GrpB-like predicted nucleotidyltransferase (UPF0157 family)